ncbi:polymer-forming cytoskeletal protein [Natronolimnohabitans sp. A-GB9]|uniref:polymer-forming cytoskeletal protein n=1 Tax=Natronolimnohabitans sp. A-GB9 TaxID=3069757 RepID=UPI0027B5137B|nr:polymer-forming cytoskeletal protein [Natronolimnohabitans sp. A-GB9]MDQ2050246.1 polymer-forming cytoskeletal protein [Natronolimnohabitans sp. A-GB9]
MSVVEEAVMRFGTTALAVLVVSFVVLAGVVPATVVAQSDSETSGTVVVEEGETVEDVEAFAGTVVIEGTVTNDVEVVGGDVRIDGEVGGDVESVGGSVTIAGTVDGDLESAGGSVTIAEGATVGGNVGIGAGSVTVDGTIEGDAEIGADTIQLGDDAAIEGDLRYGGDLEGNTDAVAGEIEEDPSIGVDVAPSIPPIASWLFSAYALVLNLLLGAALLALFPRFSDGIADRVGRSPVRSGLAGLGVLVGVPILLLAMAITVIGIPFTIIGAFAFAFVVWIGIVYGRFAVAAWLLSLVDVEHRWLALVVGMVGGALLAQVPYVGSPINFVVFLLGLGALAAGLYSHWRAGRQRDQEPRGEIDAGGPASD